MKRQGNGHFVIVADPSALEEILRAEGKYPERDRTITPRVKWFTNQFNQPPFFANESGETWKQGRYSSRKQVLPRNVNSYIPGLHSIYARFTDYLKRNRDSDQKIDDFAPLGPKLTMEATGKFVFDVDLHILNNPEDADVKFMNDVCRFFEGVGRIMIEPPTYKLFRNKFYYFMKDVTESMTGHASKYAEIVNKQVESGEVPGEVQGMLEQWLREKQMSLEQAMGQAAGMLIAGVHTTANQSTFLMYEMAKNPEVQERLYNEIKTVLGDRPPTAEDLAAMPYMKGCVLESFRVRSTSSLVVRVLQEDAVILGYHVPAGTTIWYSVFSAGLNKDIFEDPLKFKPERWDRNEGHKHHPFALLPFGFGPRNCYGKRFAELEMRLLLVEMIRNFKVSTDLVEMKTVEGVVVTAGEKVPLYFIDRE